LTLLSAAAIAGVAIVNTDILAINGISINIVYSFLIVISSSSSMLPAMATVTTAAATTETVTAVATATTVKRRWKEAKKAIELFKFILINRWESLREVFYQANYLSQIVISAGLSTDLLSVNLSIC
jgi:hypothetical protein